MSVTITGPGGLDFEVTINDSDFDAKIRNIERDLASLTKNVQQSGNDLDNFFKKAAASAAGLFSVQAVKNFTSELINVRGEFEQLNVAYETILKSKQKGDALFNESIQLAATTPFNLTDVAQSTKQLLAYGTNAKDVTNTVRMLGDVAAGVSAPLTDIVYLYGTLQTQGRAYAQDIRQFTGRGIPIIQELAKQFGVTDAQVNKLVEEGKVGFPQVQKAFESLTGSGGIFYNLMEKQSQTLTGQLSNLQDAWAQMLNELGKNSQGILSGGIAEAADLVKNYKDVLSIIGDLIIIYGSYKAAIILTTSLESIQNAVMLRQAVSATELTTAQTLLVLSTESVASALESLLTVTGLANPYVALALAIGTAIAMTVDFTGKTNYAARAAGDYITELDKERSKLGDLFGKLEATTVGTKQRADAVKSITDAYKDYLPKLDLEKASISEIDKAYASVNAKITENIALKVKATQTDEMQKDFAEKISSEIEKINSAVEDASGAKQAGKASALLTNLIQQAQDGKLFFGPGDRDRFHGGSELSGNMSKYAEQLLGSLDVSSADVSHVEYALNNLQRIIDDQRRARKSLNDFYAGAQPSDTAPAKKTDAQIQAEQFAKDLLAPLQNFDKLVKEAANKADVESIQKALQEKLDALAPDDKQQAILKSKLISVQKILDTYSPKADAKAAGLAAEAEQNRLDILGKVYQLNEKYNAKTLDDDSAKMQAIRDEYNKLKAEIDKYNANPKNTKKVNSDILKGAENNAIDNQADLNENAFIQRDLDKKKQLYAEYEQYREKLGNDAADAEYSDLLKSGKSLKDFVKTLQDSLALQKNDLTPAAFEERAKLYDKYSKDIEKSQADFNLNMLSDSLDFYQRNKVILENAANDANAIQESANKKAADLQDKGLDKEAAAALQAGKKAAQARLAQGANEVDERMSQQAETLQSYKDLSKNLENVTLEQAGLQIKQAKERAKAEFDAAKIGRDTYDQLIALINKASNVIATNTIVNSLNDIGDAIEKIGQSAAELDKNFSSTLTSIGNTIKQVAALGKNIDTLEKSINDYSKNKAAAGGGFLGTVSAISQIIPVAGSVISSVVSLVGGVINAFKAAKESAKEAAQEMLNYQNSLITGEIAYNELLRERAATIKDINDLTVQQLEQQQQLLASQQQQAQADYNSLLATIQASGQQIIGEHTQKYGGFLGIAQKTKVVQDLAGLGGADYDQLEKLYTEGKLTDSTKQWFEQLQKVHDEMGDISDETQQVNDQIAQIFTGTTADSLEQAILDGLKAGKRGFADFSDDFQTSITDAITSTFESTYLKDKVQAYYNEFAQLSESGGGLTADEITQLKAAEKELIDGASAQYDELLKVIGGSSAVSGSSSSASGKVSAAITEDSATEVLGALHGIQLSNVGIRDNTLQIAMQGVKSIELLSGIRDNTNVLPKVLPDMSQSLKNIDKNTAGSAGSGADLNRALRSAGIIK